MRNIRPESTQRDKAMLSIKRRIEKIEKELGIEDKTQWLRFPDPDSPCGFIEIKGCRTLVDVSAMAGLARQRIYSRDKK